MPNAFERQAQFDPMRLKEEIKNIEQSIARLEQLLKQYKKYFGVKGYEKVPYKIYEETNYLQKRWKEFEWKLRELESTDIVGYFITDMTKIKIENLLQEAANIVLF